MKKLFLVFPFILFSITEPNQDAEQILNKVEANMSSKNRIFESSMTINGRRSSRTITSRTYSEGFDKAFTEYLSPATEQGTKMLKLAKQLWIYTPSTDRIVQISGHMLRQSVMGSDLSYEDMMEDRKLTETYNASVLEKQIFDEREVFVIELVSKVADVAYYRRMMWVDVYRYVPLKEELYGKSGQLLKRTLLSEVRLIQGKWFPTKMVYKDMLKHGEGTEFIFTSIRFNQDIPEHVFSKSSLRK